MFSGRRRLSLAGNTDCGIGVMAIIVGNLTSKWFRKKKKEFFALPNQQRYFDMYSQYIFLSTYIYTHIHTHIHMLQTCSAALISSIKLVNRMQIRLGNK